VLISPFTAGAEITAASLAALAPSAAFKYADQNAGQSSTTLAADTDLTLDLDANGTYIGAGMIVYSASVAASYKCAITAPTGATGGWNPNVYIGTSGSAITTNGLIAFGSANTIGVTGTGTANDCSFHIDLSIVMGAAAGTLQWNFAQWASDATNLWTRASSWLAVWQIA
jgi:hypothetical protein